MLRLWGVTLSTAEFIAGVSLALSVLALWLRHRDAGRAQFTVEWDGTDSVRILNHGPGSARGVAVKVDSSSPRNVVEIEPWSIVSPRQPLTVDVTRTLMVTHGPVHITWRDNRWRQQRLTIPLGDPPRSPARPRHRTGGEVEEALSRLVRDEIEGHIDWMSRHRRGGPFSPR